MTKRINYSEAASYPMFNAVNLKTFLKYGHHYFHPKNIIKFNLLRGRILRKQKQKKSDLQKTI